MNSDALAYAPGVPVAQPLPQLVIPTTANLPSALFTARGPPESPCIQKVITEKHFFQIMSSCIQEAMTEITNSKKHLGYLFCQNSCGSLCECQ